jgi:hypothetical protein
VATHQQTKGKLVPHKYTREQHDKLVWLQGLFDKFSLPLKLDFIWSVLSSILQNIFTLFLVQSFLCVALIMGDGLYQFIKITAITVKSLHERSKRKNTEKGICAPRN